MGPKQRASHRGLDRPLGQTGAEARLELGAAQLPVLDGLGAPEPLVHVDDLGVLIGYRHRPGQVAPGGDVAPAPVEGEEPRAIAVAGRAIRGEDGVHQVAQGRLARQRGVDVLPRSEAPGAGETGGEPAEQRVRRRSRAVPALERGAQLAERLEAPPALRVAPAHRLVPRGHERERVTARVGDYAVAQLLVEPLGIAGMVVGVAPGRGVHPAQTVHVGAPDLAQRPRRVERGLLRPAGVEESEGHRVERREVDLVPLVDEAAVRERGHRPPGEDGADHEIRTQHHRALGGGVDVRAQEEAAGESVDREAGAAPFRLECVGPAAVRGHAPVEPRDRPPPAGALEPRGLERGGRGRLGIDHEQVTVVVEDLVGLEGSVEDQAWGRWPHAARG